MEKNKLTLSWEDVASRIPTGYLLDSDQKLYLLDNIARRMGSESVTTEDAYWKVIEDEIDFRFPDAG